MFLKYFEIFTGKHLWQSLFFNKVADLRTCNFIFKKALAQMFSCQFSEIFKNNFLTEQVRLTVSVD